MVGANCSHLSLTGNLYIIIIIESISFEWILLYDQSQYNQANLSSVQYMTKDVVPRWERKKKKKEWSKNGKIWMRKTTKKTALCSIWKYLRILYVLWFSAIETFV